MGALLKQIFSPLCVCFFGFATDASWTLVLTAITAVVHGVREENMMGNSVRYSFRITLSLQQYWCSGKRSFPQPQKNVLLAGFARFCLAVDYASDKLPSCTRKSFNMYNDVAYIRLCSKEFTTYHISQHATLPLMYAKKSTAGTLHGIHTSSNITPIFLDVERSARARVPSIINRTKHKTRNL